MRPDAPTRRSYLRLAGAAALGVGLAGCGDEGGDDGEQRGESDGEQHGESGGERRGEGTVGVDVVETGRIHYGELGLSADEWLTETTVGGAEPTYDGTFADERSRDSIRVAVGAGDSGRTFDPAAVVVSPGTTVVWEWTGDGAHDVVADPEAQIGESAYAFASGDPSATAGRTYERTLEGNGNALYHCSTHLQAGMKGAIAVW